MAAALTAYPLRLNLGAGRTSIPGFVNIDLSDAAELQLDLSTEALPFDDDSVDLVFSYHTLEHVPDYLFALGEIHRVLRHGGLLLLGLPYVSLTEYHLVNPYHLHNFNEHSFAFFDRSALKGSAVESSAIEFRRIWHRHHYMGGFNLLPPPFRSWSRRHLLNVVRRFDIGLVAVKTTDELPDHARRDVGRLFDECLAGRVSYAPAVAATGWRSSLKRHAPAAVAAAKIVRKRWQGFG